MNLRGFAAISLFPKETTLNTLNTFFKIWPPSLALSPSLFFLPSSPVAPRSPVQKQKTKKRVNRGQERGGKSKGEKRGVKRLSNDCQTLSSSYPRRALDDIALERASFSLPFLLFLPSFFIQRSYISLCSFAIDNRVLFHPNKEPAVVCNLR